MNFKDFIQENHYEDVSPEVLNNINSHLQVELESPVLSPEAGVQKIRKVLHRSGWDMPALYELESEGDELVLDVHDNMDVNTCSNLYVLYYLTDDGYYDFYAEMANDERVDALLSDNGEDTQEED